MRLQAPHCPSCGAPIEVPVGASRVSCEYCAAALVVEGPRVSAHRPAPAAPPEPDESPLFPEPDATLWAREAPRFELSIVEQRIPEAVPDVFAGVELSCDRFALVSMRAVDKDGAPVKVALEPAFEALKASLESDGDPGLGANLALETLCKKPFDHKLECTILLFEPRHMRLTPYAAGTEGTTWASGEEGRCIALGGHRQALERRSLRAASDHFHNGQSVLLASNDLVVLPSPGFVGTGGGGYGNGLHALYEVANAHLGEEPLRVVTLAKNAFWEDFQKHRDSRLRPVGDVRLAAVRAIPPPLAAALPSHLKVTTLRSRRFELALLTSPGDAVRLLPLHADRQVAVWLSPVQGPLPPGALDAACAAILELLDRKDYGDNDNPRQAGRDAYEKIGGGAGPDQVRLAVIQLLDAHERVKYFRAGFKQPLSLGNRGIQADGMQQFDEGGEATVHEGHRLFFPGCLEYEGQHSLVPQLAETWTGGKASRLYEALFAHWKIKRSVPALEALAKAALSDVPTANAAGMALVTGVAL
ncbi:MAG: hypothetical protein HY901_20020 [Deltaproteobacteria bacterium]|nr:hypothetical protein [Deltaproteobacteria bacterium]